MLICGCCWCVRSWICMMLDHCRWFKSILGLWHRKLLCRAHYWRYLTFTNAFGMGVVSGTRQFLLWIIEVLIKFVYSISVAIQFLSHWMMNSFLSKGWVFFIRCRRRRWNFLFAFINYPLNVLLLNSFTWHTEWPAISCRDIFIKLPWLSLVRIGTWKDTMLAACIVILEASLVGAKCIRCWVHEALRPIKVTWLIKCCATSICGVRFYSRKSRIFRKGIGLFRGRIW